jgi:hypothetical protein
VAVTLPTQELIYINYNCTIPPGLNSTDANSTNTQPTIWFEGLIDRGIVDYIGIQINLTRNYSRVACSYDPPNYGWSSRLPASLPYDYDFFPYLLEALDRQNEPMALVGWENGNLVAVQHAKTMQNVKRIVLIDPEPRAIDLRYQQSINNWTDEKLQLEYINYLSDQAGWERSGLFTEFMW